MNELNKPKPGYKTTELYSTGAAALVLQDVIKTGEPIVQAAACLGLALVVAAYIWSRTRSKSVQA